MVHRASKPAKKFNLARYCLAAGARRTPDKIALRLVSDSDRPEESWTYGALEKAVLRVAAAFLARGFKPGERIVIRLENEGLYGICFFAAAAAGLVAVPLSPRLTVRELSFLIDDVKPRAVVLADGLAMPDIPAKIEIITVAEIAEASTSGPSGRYADSRGDDPAFLVYTSGSAGTPKGVVHGHRHAWGRRPMYRNWYGLGANDVMLHASAINWTYTLGAGLMDPLANGATAVLCAGVEDVTAWPRLIVREKATLFAAVPSLYRAILKYCDIAPGDLDPLRHGVTAGEPLSPALHQAWLEATGKPLYEALGMSEISTYISSGPGIETRPGSPGKAQPGRTIAILPDGGGTTPLPADTSGLLAVHRSDPGLMLGYWNRRDEDARVFRGDWFCGGDRARIDGDGYVWFEGRSDDVMNAMGYRVSPVEVEAVLASHRDVAEVAAAEINVRENISVIAAFIVPARGRLPDKTAIMAHAAGLLADYKCPREIIFVPSLPKTGNGKMRRAELAGLFETTRKDG